MDTQEHGFRYPRAFFGIPKFDQVISSPKSGSNWLCRLLWSHDVKKYHTSTGSRTGMVMHMVHWYNLKFNYYCSVSFGYLWIEYCRIFQLNSFCQTSYAHRRMSLKIKSHHIYILCLMIIKIFYYSTRAS